MEIAEIDGPIVKVRLQGACGSCPSSTMTLKMGIERKLKEMIPVLPRINMGFGQAQDYASMMIKKSGDIIRFTKAGNMGKAKKTIKDMEKIVKQIKRVLG